MKKHLSTIILVLVFFVGLSVLLYPAISNYVNSKTQTKAIANYDKLLEEMDEENSEKLLEEARAYNLRLRETTRGFYNPEAVGGYSELLDIGGTGIMGYISIDKIKVELPIYHGTEEGVLQVAAGHLEGSSLPVGGESTHAVLSAHRGLPRAKLFTDLDQMEVGDTFTITVLNSLITYEVDQIRIVEPNEVEELQIAEGEDYCTLMTCTPYGINSHRLLVRGHRCENANGVPGIRVNNEAYIIDPIIVVPAVAAPMLFVLLIVLLVKYRKKKEC